MKKIVLTLAGIMLAFSVFAQDYTREGNTFSTTKTATQKSEPERVPYSWKDHNNRVHDVYISQSGSCFILMESQKTGKVYRKYLPKEISQIICKELGREYKADKKDEHTEQ